MHSLSLEFWLGRSTISTIIRETCTAFWEILSPLHLRQPATEDWLQIAEGFRHTWDIPNCIGAIDRKRIHVKCPNNQLNCINLSCIMCKADGLRTRWHDLTTGITDEVARKWWKIIESNYAESSVRHYHTLVHVADMFEHYDQCQSKLKAPNEVAYAIFFHDLVYDPKSSDENEEGSIELFKRFSREAKIPKESSIYVNVIHLISLTTTHLTEEHKQLDVYGDGDQHYFLDFDMVILGGKANDYDNYAGKIRQEYSFLSEITYKCLRAKVLKSFLQIPKIFATKEFHEKYESQARNNIQREIEQLKSPTAGTFQDNRPDFSNKGK